MMEEVWFDSVEEYKKANWDQEKWEKEGKPLLWIKVNSFSPKMAVYIEVSRGLIGIKIGDKFNSDYKIVTMDEYLVMDNFYFNNNTGVSIYKKIA